MDDEELIITLNFDRTFQSGNEITNFSLLSSRSSCKDKSLDMTPRPSDMFQPTNTFFN